MDSQTITAITTALAGVIGGTYGGVKYGKQSALGEAANTSVIASSTLEMLQAQIDALKATNNGYEHEVTELTARVCLLEDLVTQRAAVAEVHDEIRSMRSVIDNIASKVGA